MLIGMNKIEGYFPKDREIPYVEESIRDMKRNSLVPALPALVLLLLLLVFPAQAEEVPANMPAETVTAEQQAAPEEGQPEAPRRSSRKRRPKRRRKCSRKCPPNSRKRRQGKTPPGK